MPHTVFSLGLTEALGDNLPRTLIPGIEPGMGLKNIYAQTRSKPALLIRDCYLEIEDMAPSDIDDFHSARFFLKLSQESDLTPGLVLPIAEVFRATSDAATAAAHSTQPTIRETFTAQGTVWAARFVGIRVMETGTISLTPHIHLDYEMITIPWIEWFIRWDFLQNVPNDARDY